MGMTGTILLLIVKAFFHQYPNISPIKNDADTSKSIQVILPVKNLGMSCFEECRGKGGLCPDFCGVEAACCRLGRTVLGECGLEWAQGCEDRHCCAVKRNSDYW